MKIFTFRSIRSSDEERYFDENELDQKYPLYAFTTKKKVAKKFMQQRNMERFLPITIEREDEAAEQWIDCHRSKKISTYNIETFVNKNTDAQENKLAAVLATDSEVTYVTETIDNGSIFLRIIRGFVPYQIFNKKIQNALINLAYDDAWKYVYEAVAPMTDDLELEAGKFEDMFVMEDFSTRITIDQLGAFILIYSDILSERFYTDTKIYSPND